MHKENYEMMVISDCQMPSIKMEAPISQQLPPIKTEAPNSLEIDEVEMDSSKDDIKLDVSHQFKGPDESAPVKRGRGRPRKSHTEAPIKPLSIKSPEKKVVEIKTQTTKSKRLRLPAHLDLPTKEFDDADNEDAAHQDDDFPTARAFSSANGEIAEFNLKESMRIIKNGLLVIKGARLMRMICK